MELFIHLNVYSIILRLLISLIFGAIIGIERGFRNRPAGLMTYVLVSLSSTIIMITNIYLSSIYPETDPTRLAAQVVSGIGFLGAGTIITTKKNEVRGLTTAAGLWAVAGIGIAVGGGFYLGATIGFLFIMLALVGLRRVDIYIKEHAKTMEVYMEYSSDFLLDSFLQRMHEKQYFIYDVEFGKIKTLQGDYGTLTFNLNMHSTENHQEILKQIGEIPGIVSIREVL